MPAPFFGDGVVTLFTSRWDCAIIRAREAKDCSPVSVRSPSLVAYRMDSEAGLLQGARPIGCSWKRLCLPIGKGTGGQRLCLLSGSFFCGRWTEAVGFAANAGCKALVRARESNEGCLCRCAVCPRFDLLGEERRWSAKIFLRVQALLHEEVCRRLWSSREEIS
jgi:hypothetical protein